MNASLPTANELEKLPMRAVAAYAARSARRCSSGLRGVVADDILENALRKFDTVATTEFIGDVDPASVASASGRITEAYSSAPDDVKSREKACVVFSLMEAALTAMRVLFAATDPTNARREMRSAARSAERAVRSAIRADPGIGARDRSDAAATADAARQDYELLLREYGEHDGFVVGDPVVCFIGLEPSGGK
jgi:hypothetical protein